MPGIIEGEGVLKYIEGPRAYKVDSINGYPVVIFDNLRDKDLNTNHFTGLHMLYRREDGRVSNRWLHNIGTPIHLDSGYTLTPTDPDKLVRRSKESDRTHAENQARKFFGIK